MLPLTAQELDAKLNLGCHGVVSGNGYQELAQRDGWALLDEGPESCIRSLPGKTGRHLW
jgi:hypothetical protein